MNALKTDKLTELSAQQMIQCAENESSCNGGGTFPLLKWLFENKIKIQPESDFSSGQENACHNDKPGIEVKDFSYNE